ncbi:MAG: restriction endonuclease subunit S [Paludibacteraceae bacterium]|nr:restriction endonuclease subunit S [Paludibacteraceae bacterium]
MKELDALAESIFYTMFGDPITNEKGWEVKKLGEVCQYITDGSHYSPKDDENGTIPMLSVKDMQQNRFSYENCKMISEVEYQKLLSTGCKPNKGDVLIAKDGSYFKYIFVLKEEKEQALLSSIAITRPDTKILNSEYLVGYLSTKEIYETVERELLTGTAIKRVILKGLRELKVCVPPLTLQQEFASKIEAIEKQKELIKQSIKETEELFNSRMDYYFN